MALACLGEDACELERLRTNLTDELQPPSPLERELADHLVDVVWRWKRAGRMLEGFALRQAKQANLMRDHRLHAQMMRLKLTSETLRRLVKSVSEEDYATKPEDLALMKTLQAEGVVQEMGEIALALFSQLRAPGVDENGVDEFEKARLLVAQVKEIFGISTGPYAPPVSFGQNPNQPWGSAQAQPPVQGDPEPRTPEMGEAGATKQAADTAEVDEGEEEEYTPSPEEQARERARQLLENILRRERELCEKQRKDMLKESMEGPSPYERAAEIALSYPNVAMMQRIEESNFRQIWRISVLLQKTKRQGREARELGNSRGGENVHENKAA